MPADKKEKGGRQGTYLLDESPDTRSVDSSEGVSQLVEDLLDHTEDSKAAEGDVLDQMIAEVGRKLSVKVSSTETEDGVEGSIVLHADDFLIQRHLDGTLSAEDALHLEARRHDPDFAAALSQTEALFSALERSSLSRSALLWSEEIPDDLVERAIERWQGEDESRPVFSGWKQAASFFVLADSLLVGLLVLLGILRGPEELLRSGILAAKDLALFVAANAPSGDQLAVLLPLTLLGSIGGLFLLGAAMRRLLAQNS
ncbi:MAG: hypothetical protein VX498_13650 [Myxococcota bacterium]|nr:hypothetical protein [Myxococcota bacterium]